MARKIDFGKLTPVFSLIVVVVVFAILTGGRTVSLFNLRMLLDQTVTLLIACSGSMFVAAVGSVNLSVGVVLAFSAVVGDLAYRATGSCVILIIVTIAIAVAFGAFTGFLNAKCKLPSFMATLAMLIGVRGIVDYIQSVVGLEKTSGFIIMLAKEYIKLPLLIIILAALWYVFEFTKFGRKCQAIGENEVVAGYSGVPIIRTKIFAFMMSGLTTGIAAIFAIARTGGVNSTMGTNFEINVLIGIFVGGVLVRGGATARTYKAIIGAFLVMVIENGLKMMGYSSSEIIELVMGVVLLLILFLNINVEEATKKRNRKTSEVVVKS